jgi:hypothetical protein
MLELNFEIEWKPHFSLALRLFIYSTAFADTFAGIGVREPQPRASEAFRQFGDYHRQMEKFGIKMLKSVKPVSLDLKHTDLI